MKTKELIPELIAFLILTLSMALLWPHNTILTLIYLSIFILALFFWKNKSEITIFIVATIFFQIGEIIIVKSGAWTYNNPTYLGIPIWISLSWGYACVIIKRFSSTISNQTS